jgi:hypothetical protein
MQDRSDRAAFAIRSMPLFEGFPYLVTRVSPAMYHVIVLPDDVDAAGLVHLARVQATANALQTGLVEAPGSALFIDTGGGERRGRCFDPAPQFSGMVMDVRCRCDNDNRCAACHGLLHERELNANFFDERDGRIWHVPGFSGLHHRCARAPRDRSPVKGRGPRGSLREGLDW